MWRSSAARQAVQVQPANQPEYCRQSMQDKRSRPNADARPIGVGHGRAGYKPRSQGRIWRGASAKAAKINENARRPRSEDGNDRRAIGFCRSIVLSQQTFVAGFMSSSASPSSDAANTRACVLGHVNGALPEATAGKSYGALAQRTPCESWRLPGPVLPRSVVIKVSTSCQPPPR